MRSVSPRALPRGRRAQHPRVIRAARSRPPGPGPRRRSPPPTTRFDGPQSSNALLSPGRPLRVGHRLRLGHRPPRQAQPHRARGTRMASSGQELLREGSVAGRPDTARIVGHPPSPCLGRCAEPQPSGPRTPGRDGNSRTCRETPGRPAGRSSMALALRSHRDRRGRSDPPRRRASRASGGLPTEVYAFRRHVARKPSRLPARRVSAPGTRSAFCSPRPALDAMLWNTAVGSADLTKGAE